MVSGEAIGSLGMTEPHAGSDLKAIRTRAVRDGDDFVINGQKVFISNGQLCDFVVLATKTDGNAGAKGVTLFIVESNRPGFQARPKSRKDRHEGPGYLRTVLRECPHSRHQHARAAKARALR